MGGRLKQDMRLDSEALSNKLKLTIADFVLFCFFFLIRMEDFSLQPERCKFPVSFVCCQVIWGLKGGNIVFRFSLIQVLGGPASTLAFCQLLEDMAQAGWLADCLTPCQRAVTDLHVVLSMWENSCGRLPTSRGHNEKCGLCCMLQVKHNLFFLTDFVASLKKTKARKVLQDLISKNKLWSRVSKKNHIFGRYPVWKVAFSWVSPPPLPHRVQGSKFVMY